VDLGSSPVPRFDSAYRKPFPVPRDSGGCGALWLGNRGANLVRCGQFRAIQGQLAEARAALEESMSKFDGNDPRAAEAQLWLAEIDFHERAYEAAERRYVAATIPGLSPDLASHADLARAWIALHRGEHQAARARLAEISSRPLPAPLPALARFLEGIASLQAGRAQEALSRWREMGATQLPDALAQEAVFWRAVAAIRVGEPEPALRELNLFLARAGDDHPLHRYALAQRGWAQLGRGDPAAALADFTRAAAPTPSAAVADQVDLGLVRAQLELGRYESARNQATHLGAEPSSGTAISVLLYMAEEALRRAAVPEAIEFYRLIQARAAVSEVRAYATYRIAESLERMGARSGTGTIPPEAAREFRRLAAEGGDEGLAQRAVYRLALAALLEDRPAEAFQEGEAVLAAGVIPELRERFLILTAEAAMRARAPGRASTFFRLAIAENPASPQVGRLRLALGWALFEDGERFLADQEWQEAGRIGDAPTQVAAHLARLRAAVEAQRDDATLAVLDALERLLPRSGPEVARVAANRGILHARAGEYGAAIKELRPLLTLDLAADLQIAVRRACATALYYQEQYAEAEQMFRDAASREPGSAELWLGTGLAAFWQNDADEADPALVRAFATSDPRIAVSAAYARVLVRREDPQEFELRAGTFIAAYPEHPHGGKITVRLVVNALARGDGQRAYAWATWLFKQQPNSAESEEALARLAQAEYGEPALAWRVQHDVLARSRVPDTRLRARLGLAKLAVALGAPREAREALEAFVREADPGDARLPSVYEQLIAVHEREGDRARVLAVLEAFLTRFPDNPSVPAKTLQRGMLLLAAQRPDDARKALETARDSGEPSVAPQAYVRLGEFFRDRKDPETAIEHFLSAAYLFPDTTWATLGLEGAARAYLALHKPREGRIVLGKLLARRGLSPALAQWAQAELGGGGPPVASPGAPARPRRPAASP
jgi:tetratricopeptide (TPR) repeat protein